MLLNRQIPLPHTHAPHKHTYLFRSIFWNFPKNEHAAFFRYSSHLATDFIKLKAARFYNNMKMFIVRDGEMTPI